MKQLKKIMVMSDQSMKNVYSTWNSKDGLNN